MFPTSSRASGLRISLYVASGALSREKCLKLAEYIEHLAVQGWDRWVLDLSSVTHMDYQGTRRLLRTAQLLDGLGGEFRWCGMSPYLQDIARVAGGHDRPMYRSRLDAVRGLAALALGV